MGAAERAAEMALLTEHLLPWLEANAPRRAVTCFLSYGAEPPTEGLLARLHGSGYTTYVPICEPERRLSWTRWHPGVEMARSGTVCGPVSGPVSGPGVGSRLRSRRGFGGRGGPRRRG